MSATDTDQQRKLKILLNFNNYLKKKREELAKSIKLPDDSGIRAMADDSDVAPNLRIRPKFDPETRLHRKVPTIRETPKFVQYSSRNPAGMYLSHRVAKKPIVQGGVPLVTNPIYMRARNSQLERMAQKRVPVFQRGFLGGADFQNLPQSRMERLRAPRKEFLTNSNKFKRVRNNTNSVTARQAVGQRNTSIRGENYKVSFGGGFRGTNGVMVNKLDTAKQLLPMRGEVNNSFTRQHDLAKGFGWANRANRFARNVAAPINTITRKFVVPNVIERSSLTNTQYLTKKPPRPKMEFKSSNKMVLRFPTTYGKLIGPASNGGVPGVRPKGRPVKEEVIEKPPVYAGTGAMKLSQSLITPAPKKDGHIAPILFSIDSGRGGQAGYMAQPAERGTATMKNFGPSVPGYRGIGSGTESAKGNPMHY